MVGGCLRGGVGAAVLGAGVCWGAGWVWGGYWSGASTMRGCGRDDIFRGGGGLRGSRVVVVEHWPWVRAEEEEEMLVGKRGRRT